MTKKLSGPLRTIHGSSLWRINRGCPIPENIFLELTQFPVFPCTTLFFVWKQYRINGFLSIFPHFNMLIGMDLMKTIPVYTRCFYNFSSLFLTNSKASDISRLLVLMPISKDKKLQIRLWNLKTGKDSQNNGYTFFISSPIFELSLELP